MGLARSLVPIIGAGAICFLTVLVILQQQTYEAEQQLILKRLEQDEAENRVLRDKNAHLREELVSMKHRLPEDTANHKLAVLVPFRKADAELVQFVPHMHKFLKAQGVNFQIFVINQIDEYRFNRGSLLNIGFFEAEKAGCDYIVMHDVDLLPLNPALKYTFPKQPFHLASPQWHPIYHYPTFIGGVLLMQNKQYRLVNGLSSNYWGWGREDDELYKRIVENGMVIDRPRGITTGKTDTFHHIHDGEKRVRDMVQLGNQFKIANQRDPYSGLNTTEYDIVATEKIGQEAQYTRIDVKLVCHPSVTPWCIPPDVCPSGYHRHKPSGLCRRCGRNCWKGFVLAGECSEDTTTYCLKLGRDISLEEAKAKGYKMGTMNVPRGH